MGAEAFSWAGRTAQAVSPTDVPENHQLRHALGQFGDTAEEANWWEKYNFDQDAEEDKQQKEERRAGKVSVEDAQEGKIPSFSKKLT